jgi:transposase
MRPSGIDPAPRTPEHCEDSSSSLFRKEFWVPRAKPQYPPQFKAEAVQLVQSSGRSISQIAKDLGVSGTSLRNWVKQAQIDQGEREGLTTEEREELRRLRRENRVLKQERDFLKKAAAFFARENGTR